MQAMKKKLIIATGALLCGGLAYGWHLYHQPVRGLEHETPAHVVDATSLMQAYLSDEDASNKKYLGQVLEVKGRVSGIEEENGTVTVKLAASDASQVACELAPGTTVDETVVRRGRTISVRGVCSGILMDVVLVRCIITEATW
jgi:hypothetical protein